MSEMGCLWCWSPGTPNTGHQRPRQHRRRSTNMYKMRRRLPISAASLCSFRLATIKNQVELPSTERGRRSADHEMSGHGSLHNTDPGNCVQASKRARQNNKARHPSAGPSRQFPRLGLAVSPESHPIVQLQPLGYVRSLTPSKAIAVVLATLSSRRIRRNGRSHWPRMVGKSRIVQGYFFPVVTS